MKLMAFERKQVKCKFKQTKQLTSFVKKRKMKERTGFLPFIQNNDYWKSLNFIDFLTVAIVF